MNRIIASTALALMMSTAAFADGHGVMKTYTIEQTAGDVYASDFIGARVYSAEKDYDGFTPETRVADNAEKEWDDIGEVNDVILGRDGQVKAVILGVGGFLGIGEKDVAIPMDQIKMVMEEDADDADDYFLVIKTNKQQLEEAEGFSRTAMATEQAVESAAAEVKEETSEAATAVEQTAEAATQEVEENVTTTTVKIENAAESAGEQVEQTAEAVGQEIKEGAAATGAAIAGAATAAGNAIDNAADSTAELQADLNRKNDQMDSRLTKLEATDGEARAMAEGAENQADTMEAKPVTTLTENTQSEGEVEGGAKLAEMEPAKPDTDRDADVTTGANAEQMTTQTAETQTETVVVTQAEPTTEQRMDGERVMLPPGPVIEREGYAMAERDALTTEDLTGARVYGKNDEDMGEIDRLLVSTDGKIERAVLDIGGFLGLGEHSIAVTMDELQILQGADGDFRVYIDATQEQLEAQPEFEG